MNARGLLRLDQDWVIGAGSTLISVGAEVCSQQRSAVRWSRFGEVRLTAG